MSVPVNSANAVEVAKVLKDGAVCGAATVRRSASIAKLAAALCSAQGEVKNPIKNKQNPHLKNWYADLVAVLEAILPAFNKHKLCIAQMPCELDGEPAMQTLLLHESGEWMEFTAKTRPPKTDPQSVGSSQTYARRYALLSLCGIAADDDDDGTAARPQPQAQQPQRPAERTPDQARPPQQQAQPRPESPPKPDMPLNGQELHRRLDDYDAKLAGQKLCARGALLAHVAQAGVRAGYAADLTKWAGPAIPFAVDAAREFDRSVRPAAGK